MIYTDEILIKAKNFQTKSMFLYLIFIASWRLRGECLNTDNTNATDLHR